MDEEAEGWLNQLFEDVAHNPQLKYGEDQRQRMEWEIRLYDLEHQQTIMDALARWLKGDDPRKIGTSLSLLASLQSTRHLRDVEQLRDEVAAGCSPLSKMWLLRVENTIKRLKKDSFY